jgi:hypothetical protein
MAELDLGLGLAFSRRGVDANNGRIHARNLPERDASSPSTAAPGSRRRDGVVSKLHAAKRTAARQAVHHTLPGSGALL